MSTREEIEALGFKVPDAVEPIVAYRSWQLLPRYDLLSHNHTPWKPGEPIKAKCKLHRSHKLMQEKYVPSEDPSAVPMERCTCGIYAAKADDVGIVPCQPSFIFGEVYLWGKIIEGSRGYRAEYAYPKQFFVLDSRTKERVERLGFGVPVTVVWGATPYKFPFPAGNLKESLSRQGTHLLLHGFSGLPALILGVVDALTLDMSRAFNQVLVAILCSLGLVVTSLSIYLSHLRKKMEKMMGMSNVRVNGAPVKLINGHHQLRAIEKKKKGWEQQRKDWRQRR